MGLSDDRWLMFCVFRILLRDMAPEVRCKSIIVLQMKCAGSAITKGSHGPVLGVRFICEVPFKLNLEGIS